MDAPLQQYNSKCFLSLGENSNVCLHHLFWVVHEKNFYQKYSRKDWPCELWLDPMQWFLAPLSLSIKKGLMFFSRKNKQGHKTRFICPRIWFTGISFVKVFWSLWLCNALILQGSDLRKTENWTVWSKWHLYINSTLFFPNSALHHVQAKAETRNIMQLMIEKNMQELYNPPLPRPSSKSVIQCPLNLETILDFSLIPDYIFTKFRYLKLHLNPH